jgi:type II secretory pathway pseudopilin PulG
MPTRLITNPAYRPLLVNVIVVAVLSILIASGASILYARRLNAHQAAKYQQAVAEAVAQSEQKLCKIIGLYVNPAAPPPDTPRAKAIRDAMAELRRLYHCP